jgi:hypothetical protein
MRCEIHSGDRVHKFEVDDDDEVPSVRCEVHTSDRFHLGRSC